MSAPHPVLALESQRLRIFNEANLATDEAEVARLMDAADAVEDEIRAMPCDCREVEVAHMRIIARDAALGERTGACVATSQLAEALLARLGEAPA